MKHPNRVYLDTETCGLHGIPVLLQYAFNDGPVVLHEFFHETVRSTMSVIERFLECQVIGFNLAFDWFHLQKFYNICQRIKNKDEKPSIAEVAEVEMDARDGDCIKPASALDLMLHFRKTPLQITMNRGDICIRKVPRVLAKRLADLLTEKLSFDPILFAGRKKDAPIFKIKDIDDTPHLKNIVLKFQPSGALKNFATHLLGVKNTVFYDQIEIDKKLRPYEYGWAPYHKVVKENWKKKRYQWPKLIDQHIDHWRYRDDARDYAKNDVIYTRGMHEYTGWVDGGDNDSILSCLVASCRWKGYALDIPKLEKLILEYKSKMSAPMSPRLVKEWIHPHLNPIELVLMGKGTGKKPLTEIIEHFTRIDEPNHEAAIKARAVLDARRSQKKIEILEKLLIAGRFHPSIKVIGSLSGRMSGTDGLNALGIDRAAEVRECFPMALPGEKLSGGDMVSFEVVLAASVYKDPELDKQLMTCEACKDVIVNIVDGKPKCPQCGGKDTKSFHGMYGEGYYDMTYEQVMATKKEKNKDLNKYNPAKNAGFATIYGAQPAKLAETLNVPIEKAEDGYRRFWNRFTVAGRYRKKLEAEFSSLYQKDGKQILYKTPRDFAESQLGNKRYFTLENYIIRELYEIARNPPKAWTQSRQKIVRSRKGEQSVSGAVRSALYSAAFATQNANVRQATNHEIQSFGGEVNKRVQCAIWTIQPAGVHPWLVRPLNIHDELEVPHDPSVNERIKEKVNETVESFRPLVPLIAIDWQDLQTWADKS